MQYVVVIGDRFLSWPMGLQVFQVIHYFAVGFGVFNFTASALADVTANIDDEDLVCHVDFAFMHVIEHLLGAIGPDFIVAAMAEEADTDDDVAGEGEAFLRLQELLLEACAAAEGYDWIFADHGKTT